MSKTLAMTLRHCMIRCRTIVTNPLTLAFMLFIVLITSLFWPSTTDADGAGWIKALSGDNPLEEGPFGLFVGFLWLWMWPIVPLTYAKGRAGLADAESFEMRAMPTLPLGPKARTLAEVFVVLCFLIVGRMPGLFLPLAAPPEEYLRSTLLGFLLILPVLLTYALPSASLHVMWAKGAVMAGLLLAAMMGGFLATPASLALTCLALSVPPLFLAGREMALPRFRLRGPGPAGSRVRPHAPPETRFRRDIWLLPLERYGVLLLCLFVAVVAALFLDALVELPSLTFFLVVDVAFAFGGAMLIIKPLGDDLLAQSMVGKKGSRFGDFKRAWSVLPVPWNKVLRGAYLYTLLTSLAIWVGIIALVLVRSYLRLGTWELRAGDGDSVAMFLLPGVAFVPLLAGLVLSVAAGDKVRSILSGGALLAAFNLPMPVLVMAGQVFPRGSQTPGWIALGVFVGLALIGSLPPLTLLREPKFQGG